MIQRLNVALARQFRRNVLSMVRRGGRGTAPTALAAAVIVGILSARTLRAQRSHDSIAAQVHATSASELTPDLPPPAREETPAASRTRLREGTQLADRLGIFRQHGEAILFIDDDGREIGGLPNLNLERVVRTLKAVDEPDSIRWSVSGTITEFSGRNYLLITRAVYKNATSPPVPDLLGD